MPIAPDPDGPHPFRLHTIEVDLQGLTDFAALVGDEVSANLHPYADRIIAEHLLGVPFGTRSASGEVHAAAWEYHGCLSQAIEALRSYLTVSEIFVAAAERIARAYGDADALSAARAKDVNGALSTAFARLASAPGDATPQYPHAAGPDGKDLL